MWIYLKCEKMADELCQHVTGITGREAGRSVCFDSPIDKIPELMDGCKGKKGKVRYAWKQAKAQRHFWFSNACICPIYFKRVSTFWLVSTMAGFLFFAYRKTPCCWCTWSVRTLLGRWVLFQTLSPVIRYCRQHIRPSALPSPQTGMRRCPFLCGHTYSSHSQGESTQGPVNGEGVGTNPQHPLHTVGCLQTSAPSSPHPAVLLTPSPLVTLQISISP